MLKMIKDNLDNMYKYGLLYQKKICNKQIITVYNLLFPQKDH